MNEKLAKILVGIVTFLVIGLVTFMYVFKGFVNIFKDNFPTFDICSLPLYNAIFNSIVSISLVLAFYFIKNKNIKMHQYMIYNACFFSMLFLLNYVFYHLISENTKYGDEGVVKYIYLFILFTHIVLAALSFPFILWTLFLGLTNQIQKHRRIAKYVFPIWLYVAITGVVVYIMISPYYTN